MAISQTQIVDYLNKKVGYSVAKTDISTAKYPFNESIPSPLLTPGQYVWQQDYAIPVTTSAPTSNTVVGGSTIVSVYNTNTSAVVQLTSLSESEANETWSTGITNWIPPSFGSGYQLKLYAGPSGASAATAVNYTQLPVAGSGNNDSWFFDYQAGIVNFADTNVPTAVSGNVVYAMGAVYTGALGITSYANVNIVGNITSTNGNLVFTNGNLYANQIYGNIVFTQAANVAFYDQVTPLSNNQTYYLEFANVTSGNSIVGAVTTINVNPSTSTINALAFAGGTGSFTTVNTSGNLVVGGNAKITGNLEVDGTLTYLNTVQTVISGTEVVAGVITANSTTPSTGWNSGALQVVGGAGIGGALYVQGGIQNTPIGSTSASTGVFTHLSASDFNGVIGDNTPNTAQFTTAQASQFLAATLGNAGAVLYGTLNSSSAAQTNITSLGTLTGLTVSGATALDTVTGASFQGIIGNATPTTAFFTTANATTLQAATIGNVGASLYGTVATAAQGSITSLGTLTGLTVSGITNLTNSTNNNGLSYSNGALQVAGGAGINGNLYVGGNITLGGNINLSFGNINTISVTGNTAQFFGNAAGFGALYAGIPSGYVVQPQTVLQNSTNFNGYAQINHQNINSGANASTDYVATADTGGANSGYIDMGINSSGFVGGAGNELNYPLDGYLVVQGTSSGNGNLILSTEGQTDIVITTNGQGLVNQQARFKNNVGLIIYQTTTSTSTTSGALQVDGGVGIQGNIYAGSIQATPIGTYAASSGTFTSLTATGNISDIGGGLTTSATSAYLFNENATTLSIGSAATSGLNIGNATGTLTAAPGTLVGTQTTQNVYNTVATTVNAFGAATNINMGASSGAVTLAGPTLNVNGANPTLATSSTGTLALFNTNATTVNAFGAATTINIGNNGGTNNISGIVKATANVVASSSATNTRFSSSTGALTVPNGGVGIGGSTSIGGSLYVGSALTYTPSNGIVQVGYSVNNYSQFAIQNANNGNNASTDIAAIANNGSDNDTYVDMGIVSSGYSQSAYNLYNPNDGYLIVSGNTTTGGGNLILNTYQANDIIFATGGTTKQFEVARITSGNVVVIKSSKNAAPAANVGALQVWGGSSVSGNAYVGGAMTVNGSQSSTYDFKVSGVNSQNLLWVRPSSTYDSVIIGNASTTTSSIYTGAILNINSNDAIILPAGTNGQRPSAQYSGLGATDIRGMLRFNTTINNLEYYNGTSWNVPAANITVITASTFSGDGSTTAFTLTQPSTTAGAIVSINGVVQIPTYSYSISGTTLTFTEAPQSNDTIDVRVLTTTSQLVQLNDYVNGYTSVSTIGDVGVEFTTGTTMANLQYTINNAGAMVTNSPNVTVASSGTSTIDSFSSAVYSSAKYLITVTSGANRQISEVLVVTDGSTVAGITTIANVVAPSGSLLATFGASYSGGIVSLTATTTNTNNIFRIKRDYQAV